MVSMEWITAISIIIGIAGTAMGIISAMKNNKRTDTKDIEERVRENTKINMKLDEICTDVKDIKLDVKAHNDRLTKVEDSCKQAHHRLDGLELRFNNGKE